MNHQTISTQWPFATATEVQGSSVIPSVVLVVNTTTSQKGTGWLVSANHIVTNEHVIRGFATANAVFVVFPDGTKHLVDSIQQDRYTDIAALEFMSPFPQTGLSIQTQDLEVGAQIFTWGHPLGYSGPAPILSVGYLAGRNLWNPQGISAPQQRLILNAAFNPGNSGGPILQWNEKHVCGMAVTKHAPITPFLVQAIQALAQNESGVTFNATDGNGNSRTFVESQIVAEILHYFRSMTQVVIGEAIMPSEITSFLDAHGIPWTPA